MINELRGLVKNAKSLDHLMLILNDWLSDTENYKDEYTEEYQKKSNNMARAIYHELDWSSFPLFFTKGNEIKDTHEIYSYDDTRQMLFCAYKERFYLEPREGESL